MTRKELAMSADVRMSTKTYAAEKQIDPDLVVKPSEPAADTGLPADAVVAPPSDAIREAPAKGDTTYVAPTPHRAETLRRGPYSVPVNPPGDPR
jgi:hypothetical protein